MTDIIEETACPAETPPSSIAPGDTGKSTIQETVEDIKEEETKENSDKDDGNASDGPTQVSIQYSAVLYTDGSAKPNPGAGGWGIHGYTYDPSKPVKLGSQKKNIPTKLGYQHRHDVDDNELEGYRKILSIDCYGTGEQDGCSNNSMELMALKKAFKLISEQDWKHVEILTDSKGAIQSLTSWYAIWSNSGWKNSKGEPVKLREIIESTYDTYQQALTKSTINLGYIPGHKGHLGNENADKLAGKGSLLAGYGKVYEEFNMKGSGDKFKMTYHDFFTKNRWYFFGQNEEPTMIINDWYCYLTGAYGNGKKDGDLGVHAGDGFISITLLKEPEPIIETVQNLYKRLCPSEYNYVVCGRLDTVLTPANYEEIEKDEMNIIIHDQDDKTLMLANGKVVCMEYNPVHLSYNHILRYQFLVDLAQWHLGDNEKDKAKITYTDLRPYLIDDTTEDKKGNKVYKLFDHITSDNMVKVPVNYKAEDGSIKTKEIRLTTKVELPDKVHLAKLIRLHGEHIQLQVMAIRMGEHAFQYAVMASIEDAIGIWYNIDTCVAIV